MPDAAPKNPRAREADTEDQAAAAMGRDAGPTSGALRRYVLLAGAAFLVSGLLALIAGGHFARPPLSGLRKVPLLGLLIPPPKKPPEEKVEDVPTVAKLHPMPATEISELIQNLQNARSDCQTRSQELIRHEERLKALQADLQRERDLLDKLMTTLTERQTELEAKRKAMEADTILLKAEERKRLVKLARIYESQEATTAAAELEVLDRTTKDNLAAKILAEVQEKKAASIFNAMKPEAAIALKEKLSAIRYQQGPEAPEVKP
jgi:flagellar motility protein MotE (MotC chaperone)